MIVLDTYKAGKYTALILSDKLPQKAFNKVVVDGTEYTAEPVYDMDNEVAVVANIDSDFKGKNVSFII